MEFSGEEALGRYLDLHGHHMAFVNSAFGRQQDYTEYVAGLTDFDQIQRRHRTGAAYQCACGLLSIARVLNLAELANLGPICVMDLCLQALCPRSAAA